MYTDSLDSLYIPHQAVIYQLPGLTVNILMQKCQEAKLEYTFLYLALCTGSGECVRASVCLMAWVKLHRSKLVIEDWINKGEACLLETVNAVSH